MAQHADNSPQTMFLCWSGQRSKQVAEALKRYFEDVFAKGATSGAPPHVEMSETLIAKGAPWSASLLDNLERAGAGVVCLTPENRRSPWLHFESGAIATRHREKNGKTTDGSARLFGFLFTVDSAQIDGPLSLFQATVYRRDYDRDREELERLTKGVLRGFKQCEDEADHTEALDRLTGRLRQLQFVAFRDLLPALEQHARRIIQDGAELESPAGRSRALSAILSLQHLLEDRARDIEVVCAASQQMFFERLLEALSAARGALEQTIAEPSPESAPLLEQRVQKLRRMLEVVVEPLTPVLDDSWRYALYGLSAPGEVLRKRKLLLVHPLESRLQQSDPDISPSAGQGSSGGPANNIPAATGEAVPPGHLLSAKEKRRALRSYWPWDRIAAYIHYCEDVSQPEKEHIKTALMDLTRGVLKEISLIEVLPGQSDRRDTDDLPLRFALRALVLKAKLAIGYGAYSAEGQTPVMETAEVHHVIESRIKGETGLSFRNLKDFIDCLRKLNDEIGPARSVELEPPLLRLVIDLERLFVPDAAAEPQVRTAGSPG